MKLVITQPAQWHLKELHDYYKYKVSQRVADRIKDGIINKLKFIADHPLVGQYEPTLATLGLGHRRFVEGNYKIVYRIVDNTIFVTDVFDARQNPEKMQG
ncbi:MAG TPA: type II toxin-antitoxin system RelE/ParE family toxin [Chitinophagales bacterium]|nr:type II toxin-antitoxin system RelE/ParE family toxin [Chitinophagales bacterium]